MLVAARAEVQRVAPHQARVRLPVFIHVWRWHVAALGAADEEEHLAVAHAQEQSRACTARGHVQVARTQPVASHLHLAAVALRAEDASADEAEGG